MVRCASIFSQLVALFSRPLFYNLVVEHKAERYSKGYSSWDHSCLPYGRQAGCSHAVLSTGSGQEPPRNMWRISLYYGETPSPGDEACSQQIHPVLR